MEFNRGQQLFRANPAPEQPTPEPKPTAKKQKKNALGLGDKFTRITFIIILAASTVVAVGAIVLLMRPQSASQFVDENSYQAVDVLGGGGGDQVYFGKITKITDRQIILTNVFYPISKEEGSTVTTLVPFVCSLASPIDQIVLNRDQVSYWYNLQNSSKVTKTIEQFKNTNNGKPNCDQLNSGSDVTQENATNQDATEPETTTQTPTTGTSTTTGTTDASTNSSTNNKPANP
ncbi:MAG: hypothetical protein WBP26_06015 [Candidatus Saccharimonadales bacterium]